MSNKLINRRRFNEVFLSFAFAADKRPKAESGTHLIAGLLLKHVGGGINVILSLIHHLILQ
jgi:hypothetical protein